jgi:uncharacterized protein YbcI
MNEMARSGKHEASLVAALRTLWEHSHGALAGQVRALVGPDNMVVWVEDALTPAERATAQRAEEQLLVQ